MFEESILEQLFQLVTPLHQFTDLGNNALLLGEGWEREREVLNAECQLFHSDKV